MERWTFWMRGEGGRWFERFDVVEAEAVGERVVVAPNDTAYKR